MKKSTFKNCSIPAFCLCLLMVFSGCSSTPFVQSTDKCDIKRHHKDDIYQVTINEEPINKHYYLKEDAIEIATRLSTRDLNKCAPREF